MFIKNSNPFSLNNLQSILNQNEELISNENKIENLHESPIYNSINKNGILLNDKPFSCHKCQRTFNSKYNVIRHLRQFHADKRMFKCNICDKDYKWVDSLHKHMKLHKQNTEEKIKTKAPVILSYVTLTDNEEEEFKNKDNFEKDKNENEEIVDLIHNKSMTSILIPESSFSFDLIKNEF